MDSDSSVTLRQARADDYQSCVRCLALAEASGEILKASLESGECVLALEGKEIVGAIAFHTHFFQCTFISLVVVAAHARRQRVASALIEAVELRMSGKKLFTSTNQSNTAAQALFQRVGFIHSGVIENLDPGDPELVFYKDMTRA
jgi:ribosomal protein S18 acetylase RimI-like enzyme